ncbi:unnamed protein product, partial [marine sediment metagenome]
ASVAYDRGDFAEGVSNDGSIANDIIITLTGDTFEADVVSATHVTATNVPAGLTASFARDSATQITVSLTGSATLHEAINSIADLTVAFDDDAFVINAAAGVTGSTKNDITVDYLDTASLSYDRGDFAEDVSNDGSIANDIIITLTGDTFEADVVSATHVVATNVPAGLTASFARDSATQITVSLTGSATLHEAINSIADLTVAFDDDAFVINVAAGVTGSTKSDITVDYLDTASLSYDRGDFAEDVSNDGSIANDIIITLTGDTFEADVVSATHV